MGAGDNKTLPDVALIRRALNNVILYDRANALWEEAASALDALVRLAEANDRALAAEARVEAVEAERADWKRRWETELAMHDETDKAAVAIEEALQEIERVWNQNPASDTWTRDLGIAISAAAVLASSVKQKEPQKEGDK